MSQKSEFIFFSDFHAHNFKYAAKQEKHPDKDVNGLFNSRLLDCVQVLRDIEKYASEHGITHLVFGGDLYHRRQVVFTDISFIISRELARLAEKFQILMIPGNHDYGDRAGYVHSLGPLAPVPGITVVDDFSLVTVNGVDIVCVPYTDKVSTAKEQLKQSEHLITGDRPSILLAHLGMQGARVGSDYVLVSDSDVAVDDVPYDAFTACFFGHYHQHQKLFRNGWFIGATHHHNWGDAGTERGFLHVTIDDGEMTMKQVETTAPRFMYLKDGDDSDHLRSNDFVRVRTKNKKASAAKLSKKLKVAHVEPVEPPKAKTTHLSLSEDLLEPKTLIDAWAKSEAPEQATELAKLGKQLLIEAESESL